MQPLFVSISFIIILAIFIAILKKNGHESRRLLFVAIFFLSLLGAYIWRSCNPDPLVPAYVPFYKLFNIAQYGYAGILLDLVAYAVPLLIPGLLLIPAFPGVGVIASFFIGIVAPLAFELFSLTGGKPFVADSYVLAGIGMATGTGLYAVLSGLLKKWEAWDKLGLPRVKKPTYTMGWIACIAVYLFIALVLIVDHGETYAPIQFFENTTALPGDITLLASLDTDIKSAYIYEPVMANQEERATKLASHLGMHDAERSSSGTRITFTDGNKTLAYSNDGSWTFEQPANPDGELITEESAAEAALDFFSSAPILTTSVFRVTDAMAKSYGYDLYLETAIDGCAILGSNTVIVSVGNDHTIIRIKKYNSDIEKRAAYSLITPRDAYEALLSGKGAYTLFHEAKSAQITGFDLVYMTNSSQGYYLPVWRFFATAFDEGAQPADFELYMPAMR